MPIGTATALLIGSGLAAAASGANAGFQGIRGKKNRELQREFNEQQQKNWQAQFDYQKYINENQYRIQARDQALAGINPIAANGGSLQGYTATAGGQAASSEAPQIDTAGALSMLSQSMQLKHDSYERAKDRENAKDIAEINAEASKYGSDASSEASHYSTDTQAAIAAMNAKNQKEIAQLNTKTQKEIANANNKMQKELQKNMQEWQDSDDHALAQQKIQRMLYNVQRDHELLQYAQNSRVAIKTETGEVKNLTIEDALKYAEMCTKLYDNSTARRVFKNVLEGIRAFSDATRGIR